MIVDIIVGFLTVSAIYIVANLIIPKAPTIRQLAYKEDWEKKEAEK